MVPLYCWYCHHKDTCFIYKLTKIKDNVKLLISWSDSMKKHCNILITSPSLFKNALCAVSILNWFAYCKNRWSSRTTCLMTSMANYMTQIVLSTNYKTFDLKEMKWKIDLSVNPHECSLDLNNYTHAFTAITVVTVLHNRRWQRAN